MIRTTHTPHSRKPDRVTRIEERYARLCAASRTTAGEYSRRAGGWRRPGRGSNAWKQLGAFAFVAAAIASVWSETRANGSSGPTMRLTPAGVSAMIDYKLGPLDKVRVRVFEWRPSRDEIVAWSALNSEYTVGPTGMVALPLIGEVQASGVGAARLASEIAWRLRERMGLAAAPDTVVDIVEYRPIYVVGQVEKPGEYAFRPGLTVLQAMSLSGGLQRSPLAAGSRLEREIVATAGELQLLQGERQALLARRARLRAEHQKQGSIAFPAEIADISASPAARRIVEQEKLVFESRSTSRATQMAALTQLKTHLRQEVASLSGQIETHKRQIALTAAELGQIATLEKKGLATSPRKLALERNLAQLEGDGLRLETSLQRARQEIAKTEIAMIEIENKRSDELTADLLQSEVRLDQLEERLATAGALLHEAQVLAPQRLSMAGRSATVTTHFTIVRARGDESFELDAVETTQILPGDTVKVRIGQGAGAGATREPMPESSKDTTSPPGPRAGQSRASLESGAPLLQ